MKGGKRVLGNRGEAVAAHTLTQQGFCIIARNFRTRFAELDIVAKKSDSLYFIEVKTRTASNDGERSVDYTKRYQLFRAAQAYCRHYGISFEQTNISFFLVHVRPLDQGTYAIRMRDIPMDVSVWKWA